MKYLIAILFTVFAINTEAQVGFYLTSGAAIAAQTDDAEEISVDIGIMYKTPDLIYMVGTGQHGGYEYMSFGFGGNITDQLILAFRGNLYTLGYYDNHIPKMIGGGFYGQYQFVCSENFRMITSFSSGLNRDFAYFEVGVGVRYVIQLIQ